ncbi:MAG: GNAT family N-acetyltransferase [Chitinophagaceae bacterium]
MTAIKIVDYEDQYQPYFERLNKAWIKKFFWLEEIDRYVLTNPKEAIIEKGGYIFMALYNNEVAGTVALKKVDDTTYEFTKMAVDENYQRKGIAQQLSYAAIKKAEEIGAHQIILYSQTHLMPAIILYHKLGFEEIPIAPGIYKRANIKMRLTLKKEEQAEGIYKLKDLV